MATRHELRTCEFLLLYQMDFYNDEYDEQQDIFLHELVKEDPLEDSEKESIAATMERIIPLLPTIDEKISSASKGWKLNRIAKAELAILRLAVYEALYDDDIPVAVAIDEAVELAKDYGQDEGYAFVNGVLSAICKDGEK
ncbi:MAG: transcription antitermination factor NusB [Eubacterium sp.]|nr:transcription antitermination factor NusB [Eubacterium sp.]